MKDSDLAEEERCCENCGNAECANSFIAYYWDECVRSNFTKRWMPKEKEEKECSAISG